MKIAKIIPFAAFLALLSGAATADEAECGRWVECTETPGLSAADYRAYIYRNSRDIEPWAPETDADSVKSESLISPASGSGSLGATAGADQIRQAELLANNPNADLQSADTALQDMNISAMILEAAPDMSPEQIAEGVRTAEIYLDSIGYEDGSSDALDLRTIKSGSVADTELDGVYFTNDN
jgi:hypothetical protein